MPDRGAFARSWSLLAASLEILRHNKVLLIYPVTGLAFLAAIISFFFGLGGWQNPDSIFHSRPAFIGIYFLVMFGFTFINVAFNHEVLRAFSGEAVSLSRGFAFARHRIKAILLWSLFAGLIGLLIQNLEQRFGFVGKLILKITGVVWSVASIFAIQVMIREESSNPLELLRKSSATLRRTWKDTLAGYVGFGFAGYLLVFAVLIASLVIGILIGPLNARGGIAVSVAIGMLFVAAILVTSSVDTIFRCALYIYASEGVAPVPFDPELMDGAWKVRKPGSPE